MALHILSSLPILFFGAIGYALSVAVYRLYFSPVSKFPGPKLAALTYWYEFYHDYFSNSGQFIFHLRDLHQKYGPIIRISPHELHVSDPAFHHVLFSGGSAKRNRDPYHTAALSLEGSVLASPHYELHRKRRAALSPFFSMKSTRRLLPIVQERIDILVRRLDGFKDTGKVVNLLHAISAFSNDVIVEYSFGSSGNKLQDENFDPSFQKNVLNAGAAVSLFRHFPILPKILNALPTSIALKLPEMADQLKQKAVIGEQIEAVRIGGASKNDRETIFHTLLDSDLPLSEKTTSRLVEEGVTVIAAGSHTVAWTLTVACYHLLSKPHIMREVKNELSSIKRDGTNLGSELAALEKLPYLTATIKEALRLAYGVSMRLARIAPESSMQYKEWTIPAGVSVSMTAVLVHLDPEIFPAPMEFRPERWLEDKEGKLDRYLLSFSAGSRVCLGLNLAWAELYLGVATLFSAFGMKGSRTETDRGVLVLFDTDEGDVKIHGDRFFPLVKEGSQGVRVLVKS